MTGRIDSTDLTPLFEELVGHKDLGADEALTALREVKDGTRAISPDLRQRLEQAGALTGN